MKMYEKYHINVLQTYPFIFVQMNRYYRCYQASYFLYTKIFISVKRFLCLWFYVKYFSKPFSTYDWAVFDRRSTLVITCKLVLSIPLHFSAVECIKLWFLYWKEAVSAKLACSLDVLERLMCLVGCVACVYLKFKDNCFLNWWINTCKTYKIP